jgi:hypothetical protein
MRKHLIWVLGLVVAAGGVYLVSLASAAPNTQSIVASVKPTKMPKKTRVPVSMNVNVSATNPTNPNQIPNPTTLSKVYFDKDISIQAKGFPTCDPSQFGAASTTQDVKSQCGDAVTGSGSATVVVPTGPSTPPLTIHADTVGAAVKGNKILLLSYNSLSGGQPLLGQFKKSTGGSKYGITLETPVPPLAGGTAVLTQFQLFTKKITYKKGNKKLAIVSARCSHKKLQWQARFTDNQGNTAVGTTTQKCKAKGK